MFEMSLFQIVVFAFVSYLFLNMAKEYLPDFFSTKRCIVEARAFRCGGQKRTPLPRKRIIGDTLAYVVMSVLAAFFFGFGWAPTASLLVLTVVLSLLHDVLLVGYLDRRACRLYDAYVAADYPEHMSNSPSL